MTHSVVLITIVLVFGVCSVVGTWAGLENSIKGLIDYFHGD